MHNGGIRRPRAASHGYCGHIRRFTAGRLNAPSGQNAGVLGHVRRDGTSFGPCCGRLCPADEFNGRCRTPHFSKGEAKNHVESEWIRGGPANREVIANDKVRLYEESVEVTVFYRPLLIILMTSGVIPNCEEFTSIPPGSRRQSREPQGTNDAAPCGSCSGDSREGVRRELSPEVARE